MMIVIRQERHQAILRIEQSIAELQQLFQVLKPCNVVSLSIGHGSAC